jgi:hypothetical protein
MKDNTIDQTSKTSGAANVTRKNERDEMEQKHEGGKPWRYEKEGGDERRNKAKTYYEEEKDYPRRKCRNGTACNYHKKGWCWFDHPEDKRPKQQKCKGNTTEGTINHFLVEAVAQAASTVIQQYRGNLRPRGT